MNASLAPDNIQPTSPSGNTLLEVDQISLSFGGVKALQDVSFSVEEKQITAIIGPNGAGKTSMLNVINGFYHPQQGQIHFKGLHRKQMRPHEAAVQGIARTFQNVALFKGMSTLNNIMAGRNLKMKKNLFWQAIYYGPARDEEMRHRLEAEKIIDFLEIQSIRKTPVGRLPYGLQKRVELGRALAMEPDLLLLDEPTAGINPTLINGIIDRLIKVNQDFGITLLVIEHNMRVIMQLAESIFCLAHGKMLANGTPDEIKNDKRVIDAYLGAQ